MEQIKELIDRMVEATSLTYDRLPDIDLYMDQVIEYLSRQSISHRENDKISSAMINNYIKDGLLPRATDKKYGRDHLAYLMMIARLKQTLSVKDTGILLKAETENTDLATYFNDFQSLVADTAKALQELLPDDETGLTKVAMRLAVSGYVSRIVCERILTRLEESDTAPAKPEKEGKPEKDASKEKAPKSKKDVPSEKS